MNEWKQNNSPLTSDPHLLLLIIHHGAEIVGCWPLIEFSLLKEAHIMAVWVPKREGSTRWQILPVHEIPPAIICLCADGPVATRDMGYGREGGTILITCHLHGPLDTAHIQFPPPTPAPTHSPFSCPPCLTPPTFIYPAGAVFLLAERPNNGACHRPCSLCSSGSKKNANSLL